MNLNLLQVEVQQFINENTNADLVKLAFAKNPFPEIIWSEVISQIAARSKAANKLPTWYRAERILYPSKVSVEQTSSEQTAKYKADLVSGNTLADLTGGFGVDSYFFSKTVSTVFHCEQNSDLSKITAHNFEQLNVSNITCITGDSLRFLESNKNLVDWIYIDPSRRNDENNRVFLLTDCEPNVPELLTTYLKYSNRILIKVAPLLDISSATAELNYVKCIHIVAINNEVKELLFEIENGFKGKIEIKTVNLKSDVSETFNFILGNERASHLSLPLKYLYEPNAAIMKSGGFDDIGIAYDLYKLHQHTHLYTSNNLRSDFPGRIFELKYQMLYGKSDMKALQNTKANVTTRNFPDKVQDIRKKWKINDGGDSYIFFTTNKDEQKIALICGKIK